MCTREEKPCNSPSYFLVSRRLELLLSGPRRGVIGSSTITPTRCDQRRCPIRRGARTPQKFVTTSARPPLPITTARRRGMSRSSTFSARISFARAAVRGKRGQAAGWRSGRAGARPRGRSATAGAAAARAAARRSGTPPVPTGRCRPVPVACGPSPRTCMVIAPAAGLSRSLTLPSPATRVGITIRPPPTSPIRFRRQSHPIPTFNSANGPFHPEIERRSTPGHIGVRADAPRHPVLDATLHPRQ